MTERPDLDAPLDAALRSLMAGEGPADLSQRVEARLRRPAATALARGFRVGLTGAALAVAALSALLLWAPGPRTAQTPARAVAPLAARAVSREPAEAPEGSLALNAPALALPPAATTATPRAWPALPGAVEPLPKPEPLSVPRLGPEGLPLTPLAIDTLTVEPLVLERLADANPEGGPKP